MYIILTHYMFYTHDINVVIRTISFSYTSQNAIYVEFHMQFIYVIYCHIISQYISVDSSPGASVKKKDHYLKKKLPFKKDDKYKIYLFSL